MKDTLLEHICNIAQCFKLFLFAEDKIPQVLLQQTIDFLVRILILVCVLKCGILC